MNDKKQTAASSLETSAVAKVHDVAEQARSAATERADFLREQTDSVKAKTAERVRKLGHAVRKIGEHMRIEEQVYIAEQATEASQRLDSVATYIDDAELGTLIRDAEDLARRNPVWVLGGTFLAGLAAGRILKAPSEQHAEPVRRQPALPERTTSAEAPRNRQSSSTARGANPAANVVRDDGAPR
jgi:hypothetical protein